MTATARLLIPTDPDDLENWIDGMTQPSVVVNNNARRMEVIALPALSLEATQPVSPAEGALYVLSAGWGDETVGTLAYFYDSAWSYWEPFDGMEKDIAGAAYIYDAGSPATWTLIATGSGTEGKQAIYLGASAIAPSVTGGSAAVASIASAANQPDIVTLNFDPTTQEYAQFSFVMPEKWNGGTITFKPHWSHAATTVNFGVAWSLQAVSVGNDDPIAVAFGTSVLSVDTGGTTNDLYAGPESAAITVAGTPLGGEMVFFRVSRVVGDAGDTMAIDARLHGLTVYVTTDAGTDA